jgi:hypothetical protein
MTWMDNISNVPGNPQNGFHTDFLFLLGEELGGVYPGNTTSLGLFGSGTFTVSPEPSTVTLLLAGAGALLGWKLRGRSIKLG